MTAWYRDVCTCVHNGMVWSYF